MKKFTLTSIGLVFAISALFASTHYYVDAEATGSNNGTSWANAYVSLQSALTISVSGDSIWVAEGTYFPTATTTRTIYFTIPSGVKVRGGFDPDNGATTWETRDWVTYVTTLSGDIGVIGTNTDNSYHVVYMSNVSSSTILDGFTITKGYSNGTGNGQNGGGIYHIASGGSVSNPRVVNCIITYNYGYYYGGGFYNYTNNGTASPAVENCTFSYNTIIMASYGGGGMYNYASSGATASPVISYCDFHHNVVPLRGGAIYNYSVSAGVSSPVISHCTFSYNQTTTSADSYDGGGGIFNYASDLNSVSSPTITFCDFANNSSDGSNGQGGGIKNMGSYRGVSNPTVTNCIFTSNYSDKGGGLYNYGFRSGICNPSVSSCTFKANTAIFGGGIYNHAADVDASNVDGLCSPVFTNCLISGNKAITSNGGGMYAYSGTQGNCTPSLTNCTFSGNYAVGYGGGISAFPYYGPPYGSDVIVTLKNVIVYNNSCGTTPASYGEIYKEGTASIPVFNVTYCDLKINGVIPDGIGNVYVNPNFTVALDPATAPSTGGDFHLQSSSPLINAGAFPGAPVTDIEGSSRPCPAVTFPDMGAYEYCQADIAPFMISSYPFDYQTAVYLNNNIILTFSEKVVAGAGNILISTGTNTNGDFEIIPVSDARVTFSDGQGDDNVVTINPAGTFAGATAYNVLIVSTNFDDATGNDFAGATIHFTTEPVTAVPGVIYVDKDKWDDSGNGTSWGTAKKYLQSALAIAGDAGQDDDEIWVKKGTQYPDEGTGQTDNNQSARFIMKAGVAIYGGFDGLETARSEKDYVTNVTILSGDIRQNGTSRSYNVVYSTGLNNTAVLDGFTVTMGYVTSGHGAGIYNTSSSPTIANCIITSNIANSDGGGIFNTSSSAPVIDNCTIAANTAYRYGGGICNSSSSPTLTDCYIINNVSSNFGGGVYNSSSSAVFTRCLIAGNSNGSASQGGGIYNTGSATSFTSCQIRGNSSGWGGGIGNSSTPNSTYTNCLISGNSVSNFGGGMFNASSHPVLMNCTFSGNKAGTSSTHYGGAIYNSTSNPTLTNCVIWNNKYYNTTTSPNSSIYNAGSAPVITYSLVANMHPTGSGNIDDSPTSAVNDPDFAIPLDPNTAPSILGDFHLWDTSPCIGVGTNTGAPPSDIEDNPRPSPAGSISDMGAYENYLDAPADYVWVGSTSTDWNTSSNWLPAFVPGSADDVSVHNVGNSPEVFSTSTASCNKLCIDDGAIFTIRSDASGAGSLITYGTIINDGTINVERYASDGQWHLVSSPMTDATANVFFSDYLQTYTEVTDTWTDIIDPATALVPGKGYALWGVAKATTYTFTGTPNTGNVSYGYTYTPAGNPDHYGFNLMGNPYPSSIDWDLLNETYGAVYYYNGSAYVTWNGGGAGSQYVPPMQGFMIAPGSAGTLNLANTHRTHSGASVYYKSTDEEPGTLILQAGNTLYMDELYILFREETTEDFDLSFDAWKILSEENQISQLFTLTGDRKLSIDQRPACDQIQLGFRCGESGSYSIALKQNTSSGKNWLEDTKLNVFTDLSQGAYSFDYSPLDPDNRFVLHLKTLGIYPEFINDAALQVYTSDGILHIKTTDRSIMKVQVSDLVGHLVLEQKGSQSQVMEIGLKIQSGIYLVMVTTDNNVQTKKIYLK